MVFSDGGTYLTAYSENGDLVHISEVEKRSKKKFTCPQCGDVLRPRKGDINSHHFAHKPDFNCNHESYLHKISKLLFAKKYNECLKNNQPFYMEFQQNRRCTTCSKINQLPDYCDLKPISRLLDLTKFFEKVSIEKGIKGFVADVLLYSSQREDSILIEFAVTHKCEKEKLNSGLRIIEFNIQDEKDLEFILTNNLSYQNSNCDFHNISPKQIIGEINTLGNCKLKFKTFLISHESKAFIKELSPYEISLINTDGYKRVSNLDIKDNNEYYLPDLILRAYNEEANFKNCEVCRYFSENYDLIKNLDYKCNKLNKEIPDSNFGSHCEWFSEIPRKQRLMKLRRIKQADFIELESYQPNTLRIEDSKVYEPVEKYRFDKTETLEYRLNDQGPNIDCLMNGKKVPHAFCKTCAFSDESFVENTINCGYNEFKNRQNQ